MNTRGQGALEYLLLIGGAVLVAVIIIVTMTSISDYSPTERWETNKEWVCDEYQETGEVENCREVPAGTDEFKDLRSPDEYPDCKGILGQDWNPYTKHKEYSYDEYGDYERGGDGWPLVLQHIQTCVRTEMKYECDKESICVKEHYTQTRELTGGE